MSNQPEPVKRYHAHELYEITFEQDGHRLERLVSGGEVRLVAVYDRDIKALLAMIDEFQCTRDSNEFAADLLLRADAALKEGRDHAE